MHGQTGYLLRGLAVSRANGKKLIGTRYRSWNAGVNALCTGVIAPRQRPPKQAIHYGFKASNDTLFTPNFLLAPLAFSEMN